MLGWVVEFGCGTFVIFIKGFRAIAVGEGGTFGFCVFLFIFNVY